MERHGRLEERGAAHAIDRVDVRSVLDQEFGELRGQPLLDSCGAVEEGRVACKVPGVHPASIVDQHLEAIQVVWKTKS